MQPISRNDIASMKERGYDPATIQAAEFRRQLFERGQVVAEQIKAAFANVTLGNGIGLAESNGMDEHEPAEILAAYRAADEKENWANIPRSKLNSFIGGLAFFNAEGLRFHLAAYLIADLLGEYPFSLTFLLTHQPDRGRFELLDAAQRACVRAYLSLLLEDPDEEQDRDAIQGALDGYWSNSANAAYSKK